MGNELHQKLCSVFYKNGYETTFKSDSGIELTYAKFIFSDMIDGEYVEAALSLCDDQLLVSYDILEGLYEEVVFVPEISAAKKALVWKKMLASEVERLKLAVFID